MPPCKGALAICWTREAAGGGVAPSDESEPAALEPGVVVSVALEPFAVGQSCPEWLSTVQPSPREGGMAWMLVVPTAESPPEEACSKWSSLEG